MGGFRSRDRVCVTRKIKLLFEREGNRCNCCGFEALLTKAGLADIWGLS